MSAIETITKYGMSILKVGRVGKEKDTCRVWVANQNITKSFNINDTVNISYDKNQREVTIEKAELLGNHTISSRNGKDPILDIKNQNINKLFGDIEKVEVVFFENKIVIKVSKSDLAREKQDGNDENNIFELFCGGSTLSHTFKMAGYKVVGGLELEDKYLKMFHLNNPGDEIYTITADIKDVRAEDYPDNVGTLLSGIPCTNFTRANMNLHKGLKEGDECAIADRMTAESLTFFVLNAVSAMSPKKIIIEEVLEYRQSVASDMLVAVLNSMGYNLSEKVVQSQHTKRKRWMLVATMDKAVNLEDLVPEDGLVIEDFLTTSLEDREWMKAEESKRVSGMIRKGLGIRSVYPHETKVNTFTSHGTRHTEPILTIERNGENLYSEFTNEEIRNIHGLVGYKLSDLKTLNRQCLGQGVTEIFYYLAMRIKQNVKEGLNSTFALPSVAQESVA